MISKLYVFRSMYVRKRGDKSTPREFIHRTNGGVRGRETLETDNPEQSQKKITDKQSTDNQDSQKKISNNKVVKELSNYCFTL